MQLGRILSRRRPVVAQDTQGKFLTTDEHSPALEVRELSKRYKDGLWANRDINITGNPGEILGILGPNGAGKTTLVRQITTELLPTAGSVHILGYDVVREPDKAKAVMGVVPQGTNLFHYLTVHQHLRIFAKLRGFGPSEAVRRADQLVVDLELTNHRDVSVEKLSGGLMRRVLVGIAAMGRPRVMILDEPTTGLDPQSRRNLWTLLRRYREEGAFVMLTTHSMEEAEILCDWVGILRNSRLLDLDTVDNLRANHGLQSKITYFPDRSNAEEITLYGEDERGLVDKVQAMGIDEFSVSRSSLEDIYLAMTGSNEGFDDEPF